MVLANKISTYMFEGIKFKVLIGWLCGGTVSLGDPNLSETNIKKQLEETKARVLVSSIDYLDKYYKGRMLC